MTAPRDPDAIVTAWLEEGPTELPASTRRAIAVNTRSNPQSRRWSWLPWRRFEMQSYGRLATAAVVAVVLFGGGAYLLSRGQATVGGSPTPAPAITPIASPATSPSATSPTSTPPPSVGVVPTSWTAVTSSRFRYSTERPSDWVVTAATEDWPPNAFPEPDGPAVDRYATSADSDTYVLMTSNALAAGETEADSRARLEADNANLCQIAAKQTTVDGVTAQRANLFCGQSAHIIEVSVAHGGRFYLLDWFSPDPPTEVDTAIFDRFLSSFRFGA
jgi:hypothetical protein